jgi:hypothetical protein
MTVLETAAGQELAQVAKNAGKYKQILIDLIVQGALKVGGSLRRY